MNVYFLILVVCLLRIFLGVFLCAGSLSHLIFADAHRESPQRMSVNPATVELTCAALFQCRPSWRRVRFCELYMLTLFAQTHTHTHTHTHWYWVWEVFRKT
jgi:hypothetical protein